MGVGGGTGSGARHRRLLVVMLAASLASSIGGLPFNSLPVMLGSLADFHGLHAAAVGLMGSTCFAGYLLGTLGAPFWMNRLDWRRLTVLSAAGTALSFALSAWVRDLRLLYLMWGLIGFFASTMTCLGMRILSDLPNKERAFGVRQGVELTVTAAVLLVLPPLVIAPFRYPGAALALAGVVALLGLSALALPRHPAAAGVAIGSAGSATEVAEPVRERALPARAWGALAVFFLFLVGNIGLWAFLERIGAGLQVSAAAMGLVFAVLKLLGGVAGFGVASVGERFGPRQSHAVVALLVALGLGLLALAHGFAAYALGAWIWEFAFTCGCVFQAAGIARSDDSGRAIVLVPAAFALGSMVGPAVAGRLVADGHFGPLLGLALASSVVPLLAASLARHKSK